MGAEGPSDEAGGPAHDDGASLGPLSPAAAQGAAATNETSAPGTGMPWLSFTSTASGLS